MYKGDLPLECKQKAPAKINLRFFLAFAFSALLHLLLYLMVINRDEKSSLIESEKQETGIEVSLTTLPALKPASQPAPPPPPPTAKPDVTLKPVKKTKPASSPSEQASPKPKEKVAEPKPAKPRRQPKPPAEKSVPEFKDDFEPLSKPYEHEEPKPQPPEKTVEPKPVEPPPPKPPEPVPEPKQDLEPVSQDKPETQPAEPSEQPAEKSAEPKPAKPGRKTKSAKAEPVPEFKDDFGQLSNTYRPDSPETKPGAAQSSNRAKPDTGVHPGAILNINPRIRYPLNAMRQGQRGVVVVLIHINTEGHVSDVDLVESSGYDELDNQVLGAVQHWRFTPPMRGSMPVESTYKHTVIFGADQEVVDDFATHWQQIKLLPADGKR